MSKGATLLLVCVACLRAQDSSIEGTTIDSSDGRPLEGVHVRVFTVGASGAPTSYGAVSDRSGHFSIGNVRPGSYVYFGERTGYITVRKGGGNGVPFPGLTVKAGAKIADFRVEMTPRASIAGRVLDEYGDPVQNASIQITPVSPDADVGFFLAGNGAQTDDRGEYRIPAAPGKYYVKANVSSARGSEIRTDGTSPAAYAPTYYPNSATTDRAVAVTVAAGAAIHGMDIRMAQAASSMGAHGVVTGAADLRSASVHLWISEKPGLYTYFGSSAVAEGRFSFSNLRAGQYRLFARMQQDGRTLQSQTVEFRDTSPPSGVELRLSPGMELTATVAPAGGELPAGNRTVRLVASGDARSMLPGGSGQVDGDGKARIAGVFPGKYRVSVQGLPEGAYVSAVEMDGTAAAEEVELTRSASRMKITIGRNGGQISGSLVDSDGTRLSNTLGAVLISGDKNNFATESEDRLSRVAPDGSYSFKALRPGKYWLLGIDALRTGNWDAEMLKKMGAAAEEVEVKEGERVRKDVRVYLPKEDANAKK